MADWFQQNAPAAPAAKSGGGGDWFASNAPKPPEPEKPSALARFAGGVWDQTGGAVVPMVKRALDTEGLSEAYDLLQKGDHAGALGRLILSAAKNPAGRMADDLIETSKAQGSKAIDAAKGGDYTGAVVHGAAAAVPIVAPSADALEKGRSGDVAGALGDVTGNLGGIFLGPKVAGKVASKVAGPAGRVAARAGDIAARTADIYTDRGTHAGMVRAPLIAIRESFAERPSMAEPVSAAPVEPVATTLDPRIGPLVEGKVSANELFGPMSEIPPELPAPAAAEPVRLRNPATEAPRDRVTLRNPEPPPMTDAEVARMRGDARRQIVLRNKPEPAPQVEAPPAQPPVVEATPAGSMDDLRRGVQSILDRRKSSAGVNKPAPMSEQPVPIIETPAPEAPKPVVAEPAPQSEPVRLRNPAEDGAAPDWETKPRAAKVDAFVEHLRKYNFTPELVDAISDRQWSAVAQSAGQNAPSAETIAAIKEKFGAGHTPKKPPAAEKVTLRNPAEEAKNGRMDREHG